MDADERAEDVDNRRLVIGGVAHDALQGVDRSQPDVNLLRAGLAELLDGLGEPIGNLPLLGQLLLEQAQPLLFAVLDARPDQATADHEH